MISGKCYENKANIFCDDVYHYLVNCKKKYELIFADPPYESDYRKLLFRIDTVCSERCNVFIFGNVTKLIEMMQVYTGKLKFSRFFIFVAHPPTLVNSLMPLTAVDYIAHFYNNSYFFVNNNDGFSDFLGFVGKKRVNTKYDRYEKDMSIAKKLILHYSVEGDNVLDLFAGSGNLGIAAYELKRNVDFVEVNAEKCKTIKKIDIAFSQSK